jgi:hypothetical protein
MKNRLYLVLGGLLVAAVAALWVWAPGQPREPVYDGKPLSYWITLRYPLIWVPEARIINGESLDPSNPKVSAWARQVMSDSNAVPFLIRVLKRDSWFGAAFYRKWLWSKSPPSTKQRLPPPPADNALARTSAAMLLGGMGSIGKPAIPALIRAFKSEETVHVKAAEAEALGKLGKGDRFAAAALSGALTDKEWVVRIYAIQALTEVGVGKADRAALAALTGALNDKDSDVRPFATNALLKIDPEAAAKAGVKMPSP